MDAKPFRWNLTHRNHLGKLIEGERPRIYNYYDGELLACCARVIASAGDSNLVFVARSPESIFDLLSGLLFDSSWFERLELFHFSMRFMDENKIKLQYPGAIGAMRDYLHITGLCPEKIASSERTIAFIDLALTGDTFGRMISFLFNWSNEISFDWRAVRRRIKIVGLTSRTKTSPNTWRWQQHAEWRRLLPVSAIKNVSISRNLWGDLGDYLPKASMSYTPDRWGDPGAASPGYSDDQLKGLRLAYDLFEIGRTKKTRDEFASCLTDERAMKHDWFRKLVVDLRS